MSSCDSDAPSRIMSIIPPATFVRPPGETGGAPTETDSRIGAPAADPPRPGRRCAGPAGSWRTRFGGQTLDLTLRLRPEAAGRFRRAARPPERAGPASAERSRSTRCRPADLARAMCGFYRCDASGGPSVWAHSRWSRPAWPQTSAPGSRASPFPPAVPEQSQRPPPRIRGRGTVCHRDRRRRAAGRRHLAGRRRPRHDHAADREHARRDRPCADPAGGARHARAPQAQGRASHLGDRDGGDADRRAPGGGDRARVGLDPGRARTTPSWRSTRPRRGRSPRPSAAKRS